MQPASCRCFLLNAGGFACKNLKGTLKNILRQMSVLYDTTAKVQNHRSMTLDQRSKRFFIAMVDELTEQFCIWQLHARQAAKLMQKRARTLFCHDAIPHA